MVLAFTRYPIIYSSVVGVSENLEGVDEEGMHHCAVIPVQSVSWRRCWSNRPRKFSSSSRGDVVRLNRFFFSFHDDNKICHDTNINISYSLRLARFDAAVTAPVFPFRKCVSSVSPNVFRSQIIPPERGEGNQRM